ALTAVRLVPVRGEAFSDTVEAGRVIGLQPAEGTQVPRDSDVEVVVSKGPDLVTIPEVDGLDLDEAIDRLEAAGFVVEDVEGPPRGRPFETDPPAGTKAKRGSAVVLYTRR